MGLFDNLDQLSQPGLSPLQAMLLGGVNAVAPYANTTDRPTSPWAALGAAAGGMGQGIQDQRAQALKQMLGAAQIQHLGLESQGLETQNKLAGMTLDTYRDWNAANPATPMTKLGALSTSIAGGGAGGTAPPAAPAAPSPSVAPTSDYTGKTLALGNDDVDLLTRLSLAENGQDPESVIRVALNRLTSGKFGGSLTEVANAPKQFEPVGAAGGDWRNLKAPAPEQLARTRDILTGIAGGAADPTKGATFFLNRDIAQQRVRPDGTTSDFGAGNDDNKTVEIAGHTYYRGLKGQDAVAVPDYRVALGDTGRAGGSASTANALMTPARAAAPPAAGAGQQPQPVPVFGLENDIATVRAFGGRPGADKIPAIAAAQKRLEAATPQGSYLGVDPATGRVGVYRLPGADEGEASKAAAIERAVDPLKTKQAIDQARGLIPVKVAEQAALAPLKVQEAGDTKAAQESALLRPAPTDLPGLPPGARTLQQAQSEAKGAGTQAAQQSQQNVGYAKDLRTEFLSNPTVKNRNEAVIAYNGIEDAAKRGTHASDLNMVYGIAKLFDPGSVVREGETIMVNNTQGLTDRISGAIATLNGGAALQPEARAALLEEARSRMKVHEDSYQSLANSFKGIASRLQLNPSDVIPDNPVTIQGGKEADATTLPAGATGKGEYGSMTNDQLHGIDISKLTPAQMQAYEAELDARLAGGRK